MNIKTFKQVLPYLFKAKISTHVVGLHGVGKSQAVKQFCEENGYKYFDLRLGSVEVGDLLGLPEITDSSTKFYPPDWLTNLINYCTKHPESAGVIFMDELNRGRRDVLQCVFQMALDGRHHTTQFPKNLHVVCASNPNTSDFIVADISDKAFIDRFCHIKFTPTVKEWIDYQETRGMSKEMINHIKEQPELLDGKCEDFTIERTPSRRSVEAVDRLLQLGMPLDLLQEAAYGLLGKPATIAFMESMKKADKPLEAKEVLSSFDKVETQVKKYSDPETGGRPDLLKITCDDMKKTLETKKKVSEKEASNLLKWLKTIPLDLSFSLVREIYIFETVRNYLEEDKELLKMFEKRKNV